MVKTMTDVNTNTYTHTRISVIEDQFEMFLVCAGMSDSKKEKILQAIENQELKAIGVYIEEEGFRIAEVEIEVDWEKHNALVSVNGSLFDTDLPGWKDNVAPEAHVVVGRLSSAAKKQGLPLRTWIKASDRIRQSKDEYEHLCEKLGYAYNSTPAPWKEPPLEKEREVQGLAEICVISRATPSS